MLYMYFTFQSLIMFIEIFSSSVLFPRAAMKQKPVVTQPRTPTDTWSGLGFSKSMPESAIREARQKNGFSLFQRPALPTMHEVRMSAIVMFGCLFVCLSVCVRLLLGKPGRKEASLFVSPERSSERDYVFTDSVRSM